MDGGLLHEVFHFILESNPLKALKGNYMVIF